MNDGPAIVPVILSGGSGTRLWPASRTDTPKQLLNLVGDHTMLRATLDRVAGIPGHRSAVVVCSEVQASSCRHEMEAAGHGDGQVIIEPEGRNTAPAVAVAALALDPGSVMLVMPADHVLRDHVAFAEAVAAGADAALTGALVTFGVVPTHPATGYGYIRVAPGSTGVSPVAEFVEKPELPDAEGSSPTAMHLWNSGMFMFTARRYLEELARFEPDVAAAASAAMATAVTDEDGSLALDADAFSRSPSISIDYAVMERTRSAVVVPLDAGWSDVGSWASLMDVAVQDASGNVIVGDVVAQDVDGSYLRADGVLLAVVGLSDVVAVTTPDAVLVAAKDRAEDVKQLVEHLRRRRRTEADQGPTAAQPWGTSEILARIGDGVVTAHTLRPGSTAGFDRRRRRGGGRARRRPEGSDCQPGAVIDLGPDSEVSNPTDSDVTVLVIDLDDAGRGGRLTSGEADGDRHRPGGRRSGWGGCSVARSGTSDEPDASTPRSPRPTKKQRQILATLPPDPPLPTIEDLVAEELEETGAGRIAGAAALQPPVALKVFRRDTRRAWTGVPSERLRFVVDDGVEPTAATPEQVRLVADQEEPRT